MPSLTKHDHVQLITRARAALETPADLSPDDMVCLIEDLAGAAERLQAFAVPWSLDIHVGTIAHSDGLHLYAALSHVDLVAEMAKFCRDRWSLTGSTLDPAELSDSEVTRIYNNRHDEDDLAEVLISLDGPASVARPPFVVRRMIVVSNGHIHPTTAELLTQWAQDLPSARPIEVTDTEFGWIIGVFGPRPDSSVNLPPDLIAALTFARLQGYEHILFDRDAVPVDGLDTFDW